jgi:hypothetical protein
MGKIEQKINKNLWKPDKDEVKWNY